MTKTLTLAAIVIVAASVSGAAVPVSLDLDDFVSFEGKPWAEIPTDDGRVLVAASRSGSVFVFVEGDVLATGPDGATLSVGMNEFPGRKLKKRDYDSRRIVSLAVEGIAVDLDLPAGMWHSDRLWSELKFRSPPPTRDVLRCSYSYSFSKYRNAGSFSISCR